MQFDDIWKKISSIYKDEHTTTASANFLLYRIINSYFFQKWMHNID